MESTRGVVRRFQIGGAIGVAIVTSVSTPFATSSKPKVAITEGPRAGFGVVVLFALLGIVVTFTLLSRLRPAKIILLEPTRSGER